MTDLDKNLERPQVHLYAKCGSSAPDAQGGVHGQ